MSGEPHASARGGIGDKVAAQGRTHLAVGDHVHRALPDDVPRGAFVSLAEHCGEKNDGFSLGRPPESLISPIPSSPSERFGPHRPRSKKIQLEPLHRGQRPPRLGTLSLGTSCPWGHLSYSVLTHGASSLV